ncbi:hypothetical protein AC249_AIPGENE25190 [Exaiptasia diaphana]|nr:hypothetical protein AC249_AIPGENE25190 [Exaiptasia diaphana]
MYPRDIAKVTSVFISFINLAFAKDCKKLDVCRCEMSDGSGIVDLWKLDNSEGIPRTSKITLVCDNSKPIGKFENGISYLAESDITTYTGEFSSKYSCAFPSSSLSAGSIILIIFFPCVFLYVLVGVIFNVKVKHKNTMPEVFPNHEFWVDFPSLMKNFSPTRKDAVSDP